MKIKNKEKRNEKGQFIVGTIPRHTGVGLSQIREDKHYRWTGGTRGTARRMAIRYGFNMNKCMSCNKNGVMVVHHVDENYRNNKVDNLRILCYSCHRAVHGIGNETQFKKGHKVSRAMRMKISKSNKGKIPWNKGLIGGIAQ